MKNIGKNIPSYLNEVMNVKLKWFVGFVVWSLLLAGCGKEEPVPTKEKAVEKVSSGLTVLPVNKVDDKVFEDRKKVDITFLYTDFYDKYNALRNNELDSEYKELGIVPFNKLSGVTYSFEENGQLNDISYNHTLFKEGEEELAMKRVDAIITTLPFLTDDEKKKMLDAFQTNSYFEEYHYDIKFTFWNENGELYLDIGWVN